MQIEVDKVNLEVKQAWVNGKGEYILRMFTDERTKTHVEWIQLA